MTSSTLVYLLSIPCPMDPAKQATLDRGCRLSGFAITIAQLGLARLAVTSLLCRSGRIADQLAGAAGEGGLACARADQRRGGQDATRGMADRSREPI